MQVGMNLAKRQGMQVQELDVVNIDFPIVVFFGYQFVNGLVLPKSS